MLREYQLTNFKAFAGPETIPIRPLTLIFGPNSSGKSSILQSLLLLKQTLEEANSSTPLLPKGKLVDLGDYREFIHRHDVSNSFSFKALFTPDAKNVKHPWAEMLREATDVGLKAIFAYDEKTKTTGFSSVDIFIGDKSLPALSYFPRRATPEDVVIMLLGDKSLPAISYFPSVISEGSEFVTQTEVHPQHGFWHSWWTVMKEYIEGELHSNDDASFVFYNNAVEDTPFKQLLQDIRNYSFEKAVEDLQSENRFSSVNYQSFLPTNWTRSLPREFWEKPLEILMEILKKWREEKARQRQGSLPTESLQKQAAEEYSPFAAKIFYESGSETEPFQQGLDISLVSFHVCSVFQRLVKEMIYLGPLRSYPERYYTFSGNPSEQVGQSGEMLPDVLFQNPEIVKRINAEFDRFGLGYELRLSALRDENSDLSNVFALRLVDKATGVSASIRDVGFGVSQMLPVIVQSLLSHNKTLLIEQPELHLHPALQAELGDLFIQSALGEQQNTFLLETHSEHLILRIMRRMRDTANGTLPADLPPVRPEDVSILYVQPKGSTAVVRVLELDKEGQLLDPWPGGFFEEGFRERFA